MKNYFKKQIALPQDHGSWVFVLSPLLIGIFAGKHYSFATLYLIVVTISVFMLRQPMTVMIKVFSGRRPKTDLPAAWFWLLVYGVIATATLIGLVLSGFGYLIYLAVPGAIVFAWYLWLVSRRAERKQAGVEVIATGVLSLVAPAAYWVGVNDYDPIGWWLWALTWLQSAASIVYAYLRLEQREIGQKQAAMMSRSEWRQMGRRAFVYTSFNVFFALVTGILKFTPIYVFIPFVVQWLETIWGIHYPAIGWKPTKIGIRQLMVSIIWTVLFILAWR